MINWLHKLLNPHCPQCKEDSEDNKVCQSCETLKMQLAIANAEKKQMLEALLEKPKDIIEVQKPKTDDKEPLPRAMSWNVRRQLMEAEDRKSAELMRKQREESEKLRQPKSIKDLEKELEISDVEAIGRNDEEVVQPGKHEEVKEAS